MLGYNKLSRLPTGTKMAVESNKPRIYMSAGEDDALPANFNELFPTFSDIRSRKTLMEIAFVRKRMFIMTWMKSTDDSNNISVKGAQSFLASLGITATATSSGNWNDWLQVIQECTVELNGPDVAPPTTRVVWPGALQMLTSKLAHLLPIDDADEVSTAEVPYGMNLNSNNTIPGQSYEISSGAAADDPRNSRLTSNETVITTSTSGTSKYDILASILHSNEVKHSFYGSPEREESPVVTPSLTDVHSPDQPDEAPTSKGAAAKGLTEEEFLEESEHSTLEILEWSNGLNGFRKATPLTDGSPIRDFRFLHPYNKQLFPPTGSNAEVIGHPSNTTNIGANTTGVHPVSTSTVSTQSMSRGSSPARAAPVLWKVKSSPERVDLHAVHHSLPTILEFGEGAGSQKSAHHTIFAAGLQSIQEIQDGTSTQDVMLTVKVTEVPAHEHREMETQTCDFAVAERAVSPILESNAQSIEAESVLRTPVKSEVSEAVSEIRRERAEMLQHATQSSAAGSAEVQAAMIFPNTEFIPLPTQSQSASSEAEGDAVSVVSVTSALTNVSREEVRRMAHLLAAKKLRRPGAGLARRKLAGAAGSRRNKATTAQRDNSGVDDTGDEEESVAEQVVEQGFPPPVQAQEPTESSIAIVESVAGSPIIAHSTSSPAVVHGAPDTILEHHSVEDEGPQQQLLRDDKTPPGSRNGSPSRTSPLKSPPRYANVSPAEFPVYEEPAPAGSWRSLRVVLLLILYVSLLVAGRQYYQQHFPSTSHRRTSHSGSAIPSRSAENIADPAASFQHHRTPTKPVDSFWDSGAGNAGSGKYDHSRGAAGGPDVGTLSLKVSYQPPSRFGTASSGAHPNGPDPEWSEPTNSAKPTAPNAGHRRGGPGTGTGTVVNAHFTPMGAFRQAWSKLKGLLKFGFQTVIRPVSSILANFGRRP